VLCNEKHETYGVLCTDTRLHFLPSQRVDAEWTGNLDVDKWMMMMIINLSDLSRCILSIKSKDQKTRN
jgi:hypothetical protein